MGPTHPVLNLSERVYRNYLFPHLSLGDLMKLREVDPIFQNKVNLFSGIKELYFHLLFDSTDGKWFSTNRPITQECRHDFKNLSILRDPFEQMLSELKRLKIDDLPTTINIESFNQFQELEILELTRCSFRGPRTYHLLFPNLIALWLDRPHLDLANLFIETPALRNLFMQDVFNQSNRVRFEHPYAITHLQVVDFDPETYNYQMHFPHIRMLTFSDFRMEAITKLPIFPYLRLVRHFTRRTLNLNRNYLRILSEKRSTLLWLEQQIKYMRRNFAVEFSDEV